MLTLVGAFIEGSNSRARTMHGLVMENEFGHDPGVQTLVDRTSRLASTNEASKRYAEQKAALPDGAPFVWVSQVDKTTDRPIHKPKGEEL